MSRGYYVNESRAQPNHRCDSPSFTLVHVIYAFRPAIYAFRAAIYALRPAIIRSDQPSMRPTSHLLERSGVILIRTDRTNAQYRETGAAPRHARRDGRVSFSSDIRRSLSCTSSMRSDQPSMRSDQPSSVPTNHLCVRPAICWNGAE